MEHKIATVIMAATGDRVVIGEAELKHEWLSIFYASKRYAFRAYRKDSQRSHKDLHRRENASILSFLSP